MENELAIIAIKGGRYPEAENIFNTEIQTKPSSHSYFGLGVCKLNMLLNVNRTVDEVIYCFEKSISLCDEGKIKEEMEKQITTYISTVLTQFKELYSKLEEEKKKQANAALLGAALTIGAAAVGSSKNSNAFTQIASLAAAGAGVGISLDGLNKLGKIPEIQKYILECSNKLTNKFSAITSSEENKRLLETTNNELLSSVQEKQQTAKVNAEKNTLMGLALIGCHYFYFNNYTKGILFICSAGGFGFWTIMDLIKIYKGEFTGK